ncbi:hypothetical protein [Cohnella zeiphila]|uniref:Uncharacterized protein n=1 Tax=Cohnella zeiphila TaxID=2761120 RepID=A0A7X0VXF9_9BACL|nr:hypothetical protein [Cohnella zeiphila]MBB6731888.1 hypothetical protein [Cohnella zeiphila]
MSYNVDPKWLEEEVYVTAQDPVTLRFGGIDYEINGKPTMLKRGVAYHWQQQGHDVQTSDVPQSEIEARIVSNPLEENDRGEAFPGLKKRGRPAKGA